MWVTWWVSWLHISVKWHWEQNFSMQLIRLYPAIFFTQLHVNVPLYYTYCSSSFSPHAGLKSLDFVFPLPPFQNSSLFKELIVSVLHCSGFIFQPFRVFLKRILKAPLICFHNICNVGLLFESHAQINEKKNTFSADWKNAFWKTVTGIITGNTFMIERHIIFKQPSKYLIIWPPLRMASTWLNLFAEDSSCRNC